MSDGIVYDFDEDDHPEVIGPERLDWIQERMHHALVGSDRILEAAQQTIPFFPQPGLYFLVWRDLICYVGQAGCIGARIQQHLDEGRPIERMAVILGIPKWAQDEFEHAYIAAWDLPWNSERKRCGQLAHVPGMLDLAKSLDRSGVMPRYVPLVTAADIRRKEWELQVRERIRIEQESAPAA